MKRFLSFLLVTTLILSLPIFPAVSAVQQLSRGRELLADPAILDAVTSQYDAFAAAHYSATAADDALDRLLEHGFYGKRKYLTLGESDPVLSAILGSNLYRHFFLTCITELMSTMQVAGKTRILAGGRIGWETYGLEFGLNHYNWNENLDPSDDVTSGVLVNNNGYEGTTTRCDDALMLVVGGLDHRIRVQQIRSDFDTVTYRLDMRFADSFSFDSDYSIPDSKGFNTTFGKLLNVLGPLMGLKPYGWHVDTSLEITVPNLCTHAAESYRWENQNGSLVSISGNGLTENPLTTLHKTTDGKTSVYFAMENPIVLSPDQPWSLEFSMDKWSRISLYPSHVSVGAMGTALEKTWKRLNLSDTQFEVVDVQGQRTSHQWYTAYDVDAGDWMSATSGLTVYRLENRIAADGTASIWLIVDGNEIGEFSKHFQYDSWNKENPKTELAADPNWATETVIRLRYVYELYYPLDTEIPFEYLEIREGGLDPVTFVHSEGSCTVAPTAVRTCSRCGATEQTETAPAAGHTEEPLPGTASTCTQPGLTEGSRCTVCGEVTLPQETIPAAGHKEEARSGKAPTCTDPGLTEGLQCAVCGEVTKARETIPATGHSYRDGLCSLCGCPDPDWIPGDADGNGTANYQDALLVLRCSIGLETLSPAAAVRCDLDGSGDLTYQDALLILRHSIGLS